MKSTYPALPATVTESLEKLTAALQNTLANGGPAEAVERELVEALATVGRTTMTKYLESLDPDGADVLVDGQVYWQTVRASQRYLTVFGSVSVERGVYRAERNGPTVSPLELKAGIVAGFWTPRAAKLAALCVSDMTPYRAEQLFGELGMMSPSRSSLDRLPKTLNARWEANRTAHEVRLRAEEKVPNEAVTVAVSLDGVMAPMRSTRKAEQKAKTKAEGRPNKGPAGYQEVGCATLTFYDAVGARLATRRLGRMPEPHKATLKQQLRDELQHVLEQRPELVVVAVADGAPDNWSYLETLTHDYQVVDFYHAAEHLKRALDVGMGASAIETQRKFEQLRKTLKEKPNGVDLVIRALKRLRHKPTGDARDWRTGVSYFERHRQRMNYADLEAMGLPIGSGVIEGTCRSLASDRLKRAGMRWDEAGGQAVLNLRAWNQSDRFDAAWRILHDGYTKNVAEIPLAA